MITEPVTKQKLDYWKQLWIKQKSVIKPNRITGAELNEYFYTKYSPTIIEDRDFKEVVLFNLSQRYDDAETSESDIICYTLETDIYVGIDLKTGFFHIESEHIEKCVPIYDDLFVTRGLSIDDMQNYVLVGQYIELSSK